MKKASLLLLFLAGTLLGSCKKDTDENAPTTRVDVYIYASSAQFSSLNAVGGWIYADGGARGLLVYRKTTDEFMAYERNCTYQSSDPCATVRVDGSGVVAVDTCCGSQFAIYDGSILQGPANLPLRTYRTSWDGATLHIYN